MTRHRYKCRPGHSDCFNPRALAISQSRALAISRSRNLALSQSRALAISRSRNLALSQSRALAISQSRNNGLLAASGGGAESQNNGENLPGGDRNQRFATGARQEEASQCKKNAHAFFRLNAAPRDIGPNGINSIRDFRERRMRCCRVIFDPARVVLFPGLSLAAGAVKGWDRRNPFYFQMLQNLADHYHFDINTPYEELPENIRHIVLYGSGKEKIPFTYLNSHGRPWIREHSFEGILNNLERRYRETDSMAVREDLAKLINERVCPACHGARLKTEARFVMVGEGEQKHAIHELTRLPLNEALTYFENLSLTGAKKDIAKRIINEIVSRLHFLNNVGLDYLSLDRSAETLSGGESQRIRLASQIGSGLTGVMYVLDEPSIGLHQRDNDRLIATLKNLRDIGNTVIVVEHDEDAIRTADFIVDMGPGAGVHGGNVVASGSPAEILHSEQSLTAKYLNGTLSIDVPAKRVKPDRERQLIIRSASGNNLKNVTLELPVGLLTCVTGVSGSGKSTLINDTLYAAVSHHLYGSQTEPAPYEAIEGLEHFDKVISVNQAPIGRTPRSNPATYTGLFTPIRELFAGVPQARERGYTAGRFSFNVKGGRCEACRGRRRHQGGNALPARCVCPLRGLSTANGTTARHWKSQYKGKNISDVLEYDCRGRRSSFSGLYRQSQDGCKPCLTSVWGTSVSDRVRPRSQAARPNV